jgi:hypothetical protein
LSDRRGFFFGGSGDPISVWERLVAIHRGDPARRAYRSSPGLGDVYAAVAVGVVVVTPPNGGDVIRATHGGRWYCGGGVGRGGRAEQHCAGHGACADRTNC